MEGLEWHIKAQVESAQALETLVDDNAKEWKYLTLPEVDVDKVIVKAEKIQQDL